LKPSSKPSFTIRDSWLLVLDKDRFAALFEANPRLLTPFLRLLIERLRHRSQLSPGRSTGRCALIVVSDGDTHALAFCEALLAAVARYAPASIAIRAHDDDPPTGNVAPAWPDELGAAPMAAGALDAPLTMEALRAWAPDRWFASLIAHWRVTGSLGRYLFLFVSPARAERLKPLMALGDAILWPLSQAGAPGTAAAPQAPDGLADEAPFRIAALRDGDVADQPWYFLVKPEELGAEARLDGEVTPPRPQADPILGLSVYAPPATGCVEAAASWGEAGAAWAASVTVVASAIVIAIAARVERKGLLRGEFSLFMTVSSGCVRSGSDPDPTHAGVLSST